jgi:hypothetical protein
LYCAIAALWRPSVVPKISIGFVALFTRNLMCCVNKSRCWRRRALISSTKAFLKGRQVEVPKPLGSVLFFAVSLGGFRFVPLVHRSHNLACSLAELIFLRREKPGAIVHGGDLDNRLKILFDALRIPHDISELAGATPSSDGERMFCLLEDDSLITRVSVQTHQLLEPLTASREDSDVDLLMHVGIHSTYPMIGNIGF